MKLIIYIPDNEIPNRQEIMSINLHFLEGSVCECDYPFEEIKKGEWKITKAGYAKCPICKCEREVPENFCGYCGADMRGKEE